jgi:hypothetical protein
VEAIDGAAKDGGMRMAGGENAERCHAGTADHSLGAGTKEEGARIAEARSELAAATSRAGSEGPSRSGRG